MNPVVHLNIDLIKIAIYYIVYLDIYCGAKNYKEQKWTI